MHKICSVLTNYNYNKCKKARKLKKRPKNLKARTKAGYKKYQITHNFLQHFRIN